MIQAKHCDLCEYPKRSLKNGLTCGLTDKKPDFKVTCPNIKFDESFKEYAPDLLSQIKNLKKRKIAVYIEFIVFATIGLAIMLGGISLIESTLEMEYDYMCWFIDINHSFLVYSVGAIVFSIGFWPLSRYLRESKKLRDEKIRIEMVLNKYKMDISNITTS